MLISTLDHINELEKDAIGEILNTLNIGLQKGLGNAIV
jgi:hypothetical protein